VTDLGTGELRAEIAPSDGNHYYLVAAFGGGNEGPSGFDSDGVQIPPAACSFKPGGFTLAVIPSCGGSHPPRASRSSGRPPSGCPPATPTMCTGTAPSSLRRGAGLQLRGPPSAGLNAHLLRPGQERLGHHRLQLRYRRGAGHHAPRRFHAHRIVPVLGLPLAPGLNLHWTAASGSPSRRPTTSTETARC